MQKPWCHTNLKCPRKSFKMHRFLKSLGDIPKFSSFSDLKEVNSYLSLNVSSALALTAGMLKVFPCRPGLQWSVVNISSLFAVQALPNWVLYCTAKAARKMMFSVLAEEEPNVKVLSYSPGTYTFISYYIIFIKVWPLTMAFFLSSMNACHKAQRQSSLIHKYFASLRTYGHGEAEGHP